MNTSNRSIISSIALTISDIVMDLAAVLIFHGGTFEMGVATSVSYYVALVVLLTHFRKKEAFLRFTLRGLPWNETAEILGKGMHSGVCRLGNTVRCIFMNRMLALTDSIWKFCDEHGCDTTRRNHLALSVEELAGNMIQHGFTDGRPHCIEARVLKKGDRYYVRFRNDCLIFDPLKQIRLLSDEDPTYHIGLRMITGLARDIRYTCVLKLNNILVKI